MDPGHQGTRSGVLPVEPRGGWISGDQISLGVGPPGTNRVGDPGPVGTTHLWPSGGRLGEWLREDQVAPEAGPLVTTTAWILVTRGQIRACAGFPPGEARGGWASGNHIPQMVGPSGISRAREPGLSGTTQGRTRHAWVGLDAERATTLRAQGSVGGTAQGSVRGTGAGLCPHTHPRG